MGRLGRLGPGPGPGAGLGPGARGAAAGAARGAGGGLPPRGHPVCFGVDPDLNGAVALVGGGRCWGARGAAAAAPGPGPAAAAAWPAAQVRDLPTFTEQVGKFNRRRHDPRQLLSVLRDLGVSPGSRAVLERPRNFPTDGKHSWYGSGYGFGVWWTALEALGAEVELVTPAVWKKDLGIYGRRFTKEDSRSLALELFPELADELRRKKDHGRAESLLIAAWGLGYRYREEETEPAEPSVAPG